MTLSQVHILIIAYEFSDSNGHATHVVRFPGYDVTGVRPHCTAKTGSKPGKKWKNGPQISSASLFDRPLTAM